MGRFGIRQAGVALTLMGGAAAAAPSPLARYVDHARVLVVSAPSTGDARLVRQDAALAARAQGLKARDLVVIHVVGAGEGEALRAAVQLPPDRFGVALVGKDGGVKLRRASPIAVEDLFQTIDAMPMRRREMRRPAGRSPDPPLVRPPLTRPPLTRIVRR